MATRVLAFFKGPAEEPPPESVLAAWNSYASGVEDAEAGVARGGAPPFELGKIGDVARRIGSSVKDTAAGAASGAANLGSSVPSASGLQYAFFFFAAGGLLLLLAFFVALPVLVLSPAKFALSFTIGNALIIAGAASLSGASAAAARAFAPERAPQATAYAASAVATLWAAMAAHSYLLSLLCSVIQVAALGAYVASFVPGGPAGARLLAAAAWRAVSGCFGAATRRA